MSFMEQEPEDLQRCEPKTNVCFSSECRKALNLLNLEFLWPWMTGPLASRTCCFVKVDMLFAHKSPKGSKRCATSFDQGPLAA